MIVEEVCQRGQELALCEITGSTEDDNGARLWRLPILPDRMLLEFASHMNVLGHEHLSSVEILQSLSGYTVCTQTSISIYDILRRN
jgi:hypothetical protein